MNFSDAKLEDKNTKSTKRTLTENEIIAQCIVFLAAGFETTSATLTHCIFELATNPLVQLRLFWELNDELSDETDHDKLADIIINQLPYLDAVIKETLRKYPPVVRLERRVGVDGYKLGDIPLDKGTLIEVPTSAVHYCPEYYSDPYTFDPDRFMPENRHLIAPYTYLPFGVGPRNCIGVRFAIQEMKLCLAAIVRRFEFVPTENTPECLDFMTGIPMLNAKPFSIRVVKRQHVH